MSLTQRRKQKFNRRYLTEAGTKIGFVDVGSGGPLKAPWSHFPDEVIENIAIEPTSDTNGLPLCISNRLGESKFYIAEDERGSSLHEPLEQFAKRFGQDSILTKRTIDVELTTLDHLFEKKQSEIDALDVNTEGHDFQVLEGAQSLLENGCIKLIKVEFEVTRVWKDQGWFSDIDQYLRQKGFELANIEMDYAKPVRVKSIFHHGEPLWGKAYYVPASHTWEQRFRDRAHVLKGVTLYTAADIPGWAVDLIQWGRDRNLVTDAEALEKQIKWAMKLAVLDEAKKELVSFIKLPARVVKYLIG